MKPVPGLAAPTPKNITGFWLSAIGLGTALTFLYRIVNSLSIGSAFYKAMINSIIALVFTVPSLLLLFLLIPWALRKPAANYCWLKLMLAQIISAGATTILIWGLGRYHYTLEILESALPYAIAGLLVAYWRYRAWLTRIV